MITLEDLQKASEKLDKMYAEEVYPRVLAFREAWDRLSAPFIGENYRLVAKRHGIEFLPNKKIAEKIGLLCRFANTKLNVTTRSGTITFGDGRKIVKEISSFNINCDDKEPCPTIIEATGHSNQFGAWGWNMWGVIKGNGWLRPKPEMNNIQRYLVTWHDTFHKALEQFDWFVRNIARITKDFEEQANEIAKLDAKDTDEFHALFDIKPKMKMVKITVVVEEV
jgi:hypothetical protein